MKCAVHTIEQDSLYTFFCAAQFSREKNIIWGSFYIFFWQRTDNTNKNNKRAFNKNNKRAANYIYRKYRLKMCWLKEGAGNEQNIFKKTIISIRFHSFKHTCRRQTMSYITQNWFCYSILIQSYSKSALCSQQNIVISSIAKNLWIIW